MKTADSPHVDLHNTEADTVPEYRQLNRLAIASLSLGILSAAALIHPILWVLPAVAVVVALITRRRIAAAQGEERGEALANWGLLLALLFGCWAVSWYASYNMSLARQARVYCDEWLDLIKQGRLYEVHQLTLPVSERLPPAEPLAPAYNRPPEPRPTSDPTEKPGGEDPSRKELPSNYQEFVHQPPLSNLLALGRNWEAEFVATRSRQQVDQFTAALQMQYCIRYTEKDHKRTVDVILSAERFCADGEALWRIGGITDAKR